MTHSAQYLPATLRRRFGAIAYDYVILIAVLLVATAFWTAAGVTERHAYYPAYVAFCYLTVFLYFGWCWTHGGQTVGMKVWKIQLASTRPAEFSWIRAAARIGIAALSFALLGAGFLWALWDKDKMTWHDRLSDARLVRVQ